MRACCISGCKSSGNMSSHQFPKNVKRRIDWLQRLSLTEENKNIINKLRVCYKHFKNSDYSCCLNKRRLVDTAVPSIDIDMCEVQRCVDIMKSSQHHETIQMSQQETIAISQSEENPTVIHQQQEEETSNTDAQVEKITMDCKMLMQHDESIQTFRQDLDMIKKQVQRQEKILNKEVKKRINGHPYTKKPQCGFKPVATVCDQVAQILQQSIKDTQLMLQKGHNIVPLFDHVHLQKGIRNNFVLKDLLFTSDENKINNNKPQIKYASWDAITAMYEIDKFFSRRQCGRLLKKLVDKYIYPTLIPKMKVKYVVQVLSHTVGTVLEFCGLLKEDEFETTKGSIKLPECTLATADIIYFLDDLFDSFNGRKGQRLSSIISQQSNHRWDIEHGEQHTNTVQEILAQHSSQLQKHEQVIMQQRNDIQNMKKTLSNQRPILGEVTRVHLLSPTAKKLYSTVIAMKRAKRRLKRLFDKGGKRKRIHTTSKRNTDSTAQIRRNFINMLQRNSDVKSQVYTSSL
ncbi:hypothetical protein ALC57_03043 [Trachymyrmex cornetzi]|uniref:THAP-type domain-containing protein n=1 Tax=Trachymyrmex cornetzi TaxID=471704 RepID=A0A151JMM6_9HYME|nr:hypothetical protein ALC57_03043 [Trachymyrmex cornetzi]